MLARFTRNFGFVRHIPSIFAVILLACLFSPSIHAKPSGSDNAEVRTLQIWGEKVDYQLSVIQDPHVSYDGEAFAKNLNGARTYFVVLNKAFFEKEAKDLFQKLEQNSKPELQSLNLNSSLLSNLERKLDSLRDDFSELQQAAAKFQDELKKVENSLETLAWTQNYQEAWQQSKSRHEAESRFISTFVQARMFTIEYHEVSHLLDLQKSAQLDLDNDPGFKSFSELNAFYTELAYGNNPLDVMAQAVSGLIDELRQEKAVDFSLEKVATVVGFLRNCPRFASLFGKGPMPKCCLEILEALSRQDFTYAGRELYQHHLNRLKPILTALR